MRETLPYLFEKYLLGVYCLTGTVPATEGIRQNRLTAHFLCLENESFIHSTILVNLM